MSEDTFRRQLFTALAAIPAGRVVTYGQLAILAGRAGAARWVGRELARLPHDSRLPWFRVVNAAGAISFPPESEAALEQANRLRAEGVEVSAANRIRLSRYRWC